MISDLNRIVDIEFDGIDMADYPDFCDSYISKAGLDLGGGNYRDLTDQELDWLNSEKREFVYNKVYNSLY